MEVKLSAKGTLTHSKTIHLIRPLRLSPRTLLPHLNANMRINHHYYAYVSKEKQQE